MIKLMQLVDPKILVLEAGRVVERGVHEELVGLRGLYFELYQRQVLNTTL